MAYEEALRSVGSLMADSSVAVYTGVPDQPGSASPNAGFQYRFVKVTGKQLVGLCTSATDHQIGILQNKPQHTGNAATVGFSGISRLIAGGTVAPGDLVAPNGTGEGVTDNVNGKWVCVEGGAVGNVISVFHV